MDEALKRYSYTEVLIVMLTLPQSYCPSVQWSSACTLFLQFDMWANRDCWEWNIPHWGWFIIKGHEDWCGVPFAPDLVYEVCCNTAAEQEGCQPQCPAT